MADIKKQKKKANEEYSKEREAVKGKKNFAVQLIPYILIVLAIWFLLCFVATMLCNPDNILGKEQRVSDHTLGPIGYYTGAFFMGLMGPSAIAIPILMIVFVAFWKTYSKRSFIVLNAFLALAAACIIAALIHIIMYLCGVAELTNDAFDLFDSGVAMKGGGIIGGCIGYWLYYAVKIGSVFVLAAILLPITLFLVGTTPLEVIAKIKAKNAQSREKKAEKAKEKKEREEAARKEREAEEKEKRAIEREQDKLDREAQREQDKLDREAAREQARLDKEHQRAMALAEKNGKNAKDGENKDNDGDGDKLVLPPDLTVDEDDEEELDDVIVEEEALDDELIEQEDEIFEEDDKIRLNAFTDEEKSHIDSIKPPKEEEYDEDEDLDELGAELVFPSGDDVTVFVDPKGKKSTGGLEAVDDIAEEFFGEDDEDDDIFVPAVQPKPPKSADEYRAQNENNEERFIGEKPTPPPPPVYNYPPVELLEKGSSKGGTDQSEIDQNISLLREVLSDFRIPVREITCSCGPTITRYEVRPEAGVRVKQIAGLVDDISLALAKSGVRIEAPIPGKAAVGIEVPNDTKIAVKLRGLIENPEFVNHKSKIASCLGADVSGRPVFFDIEKMPHLLVAGTTGSGKSVCINSIIMSILYHARPDEVKLILIDPKQVEFQIYKNIPHLSCRIISDPKKAAGALNSAVNEMEKRFELIREVGVRNITGYNEITKNDPEKPYMPRMVIIIDEFADLMMTAKDEVETAVVRIAQKARAAGIHLIVGTQRPSVDVITGLIKANIPSRIAFTVMSQVDSRTIIDCAGAEKLCGRGDMLFAPTGGTGKPQRVQGAFVSDEEVEKVVDYVRTHNAPVIYDNEFESLIEMEAAKCGSASEKASAADFSGGEGDEDSKLFEAAELAIDAGKISTSLLQRRLQIGYGRAAKIIDRLEDMGVVGPPDGTKPRQILMSMSDFTEMMNNRG